MNLATSIYYLTYKFPNQEMYGLSRQIQKAVVSVPSNIAEGAA
ncbi:four helix bundle protein [Chroococcidiopsis sp. TS-821]